MAARSAAKRSAATAAGEERRGDSRLAGLARYLADREAEPFDRLIYERVRLGIVSALAVNPEMSFTELRDLLGTSDGNLSAHARRLERAKYVECEKTFVERVPRTSYRLTDAGRKALEKYLAQMEGLIDATRGR